MKLVGHGVVPGLVLLAVLAAGCTDASNNPCDGVTCSGRGFCVADGNHPYCGCLTGYHPVALSCLPNSTTDPCEGISCSDHGACRVADDNPLCDCDPGYHHLADDRCEDIACELLCIPHATSDAGSDADAPDTPDAAEALDAADADAPADLPADLPADAPVDAPADAEPEADVPPTPVCGNGEVETGEDCDGNPPRSCTTSCGSTGTQTCVDCHWTLACSPPVEVCNGVDDDCVDGPDNGFTCVRGSTRGCTSSSGCSGIQTCTTSCTWGSCSGGDLYCESSCSTGQCWHENSGRTGDCGHCADGACGSCTAGDYSVPCGTSGTCEFSNTHEADYNCHCP